MGWRLFQEGTIDLIYYVKAQRRHVRKLLPSIREVDRMECRLIYGLSIEEGLELSVEHSSESYTILSDNRPIGMFGVTDTGIAWLVGSDELTEKWFLFAQCSKDIWKQFSYRYGPLSNYLLKSNAVHIRWLEWLGASFHDVEGVPEIVRFTSCA